MFSNCNRYNYSLTIQKQILLNAWPFVLVRMGEVISDAVFISLLGSIDKDTLAASSIILTWQPFVRGIFNVAFYAINPLKHQTQALQDDLQTKLAVKHKIIKSCYVIAFSFGAIVTTINLFSEEILLLCHQNPKYAKIASQYLRIYGPSLFATFAYSIHQQMDLYFGNKSTKTYAMLAGMFQRLLLILFGLLIVKNHITIHADRLISMGIAQNIVAMTGFAILALRYHIHYGFNHSKAITLHELPYCRIIKNVLIEGSKICIFAALELSSSLFTTIFIGIANHQALNALHPALFLATIFANLGFSIGNGLKVLIKNDVNTPFRRLYTNSAILHSELLPLLFIVLHAIYPKGFIKIFISDEFTNYSQLLKQASIFIWITLIGELFDNIRNITSFSLRGIHESTANNSSFLNSYTNINLGITMTLKGILTFSAYYGTAQDISSEWLLFIRFACLSASAIAMYVKFFNITTIANNTSQEIQPLSIECH